MSEQMDEHLVEWPDQTGYNTAQDSSGNFLLTDGATVEQGSEDNLIFIGRFVRISLDPPNLQPFILVIHSKYDVGIADVNG